MLHKVVDTVHPGTVVGGAYLEGAGRTGAPSPLNSPNARSLMFETSQRKTFCDAWKALKSVFGWDFVPHDVGWAHDAPPDPLVGWEGETDKRPFFFLPIFTPRHRISDNILQNQGRGSLLPDPFSAGKCPLPTPLLPCPIS